MVELKNIELSDDFYKEEIRSGFTVTTEVKKLWAAELDVFAEFIRICTKNNLRWWADGGTLLGAIRHQGFIPWDIDVDVMMTREDFDKFCTMKKQLNDGFELYTPYDDIKYTCKFGRLYIKDTTLINKSFIGKKLHAGNGIHIDIFPFDRCPDSEDDVKEIAKNNYHKSLTVFNSDIVKYTQNIESSSFCNFTVSYHKGCIKRDVDFKNTIKIPFECLVVNVPEGYDNVLTDLYDDWKTPIDDKHINKLYYDTDINHSYYEDDTKYIVGVILKNIDLSNVNEENRDICKESVNIWIIISSTCNLKVNSYAYGNTLSNLKNYGGFYKNDKYIEISMSKEYLDVIKSQIDMRGRYKVDTYDDRIEVMYSDQTNKFGGKVIIHLTDEKYISKREERTEYPVYLPFENFKMPVRRSDYLSE